MKNLNETNLREKVDAAKDRIGKQTFRVGGLSIRLTSTLMYVVCLLCAIFIWSNVTESSTETATRTFDNVTVVVEGESALSKNNLAVYELIDKTVSITVDGAKNKVDSLTDEDIVAYVDVSDVEEAGTVRLSVSVKGADRLDTAVSPTSVKTFIDETVEIDVPVNVVPTYSIISDYDHTFSKNVETVTVSGAKSIVDTIKEARVTPELGDLVTSTTSSSPIKLVDINGAEISSSYITSNVTTVVVKVEVYTEKTVPLTYSYKYGYIKDKNIDVVISPSEITLRGDPTVLAGIDSIPLTEIDETKITGNKDMVVKLDLPAGIVDIGQNTGFNVSIKLLNFSSETISIPRENIILKNVGSSSYSIPNEEFELQYIVDASSIKKVKAENFTVEIDLSSKNEGGYTPTVTVNNADFTLFPVNVGKIRVDVIGANDQ